MSAQQERRLITAASFKELVRRGAKASDLANVAVFKAAAGHAKAVGDPKNRTVEFVLSNAHVDREGDSISSKGWRIDDYTKNPVVLFAHLHPDLPIGRALKTWIEDDNLRAIDQFADAELYPFADTVYRMVLGKFLNAVSVGFQPEEWAESHERQGGIDFSKQALLEHSVVPVPAHPEALVVARSKGIDTAPLKVWCERTLDLMKPEHTDAAIRSSVERLRAQADPHGRRVLAALKGVRLPKSVAAAVEPPPPAPAPAAEAEAEKKEEPVRLALDEKWQSLLASQPETGMGYQVVDVEFADGRKLEGVHALNGEILDVPAEFEGADVTSVEVVGTRAAGYEDCPDCGGEGEMPDGAECETCGGTGEVPTKAAPAAGTAQAAVEVEIVLDEAALAAAIVPRVKAVAQKAVFARAVETQVVLGVPGAVEARRWNPRWSKSFEVDQVAFPPRSAEQALVAKYVGCKIKDLYMVEFCVSPTRMGSFLSAVDEAMSSPAKVDSVRNITQGGVEEPPVFNVIELNSTQEKDFLVDGCRYFKTPLAEGDGAVKMALRVSPGWSGLYVTIYADHERSGYALGLQSDLLRRMSELNFLKGEAFALNGEFLKRDGAAKWDDLFLSPRNEKAVKRIAQLLNDKGADLDNRGAMLIGPPGTGKTLFGRVLLNETKATFIWLSARDFYYSGGFRGIMETFEIARESVRGGVPAIILLEDVDNYVNGGDTVDLLKTEMDGLAQSKGIVTILTTNFPELVPQALIDRPGRFHDVLRFDLPDAQVRAKMVRRWMPELEAADVERAVQATAGYSGAHVRELARFAGIIAEQEEVGFGLALSAAIDKLKEQRDLITSVQAAGSRYRAPASVTVRALAPAAHVAEGQKAGRVVAKRNEERLKQAMGHCQKAWDNLGDTEEGSLQKAIGLMQQVLDEAADKPGEEDTSGTPAATDPAATVVAAADPLVAGGKRHLLLTDEERKRYAAADAAAARRARDLGDVDEAALAARIQEAVSRAVMRSTGMVV